MKNLKKITLLIIVLFPFTKIISQTVIIVKPNRSNSMSDTFNEMAKTNLEYEKLRNANAEFEQEQYDKAVQKNEEDEKKLNDELLSFDSFYKSEKFEEALFEINKFIDNHPDYLRGYLRRGLTRYKLNNFVGAIADCNKCIAIYPKKQSVYLLRGDAKEKIDDLKGALTDYDKCISLNNSNKNDSNIYNNVDLRNAFFNRGHLKIKLSKNGCSDLKKAEELGKDEAYEMVKKYCN